MGTCFVLMAISCDFPGFGIIVLFMSTHKTAAKKVLFLWLRIWFYYVCGLIAVINVFSHDMHARMHTY